MYATLHTNNILPKPNRIPEFNELRLFYFSSLFLSAFYFFLLQFRITILCVNVQHLDSAFTERILGLPNENFKGYVEADATQRARHIPSHSFFMLHGLADSSAPYLHGIQLANALTKAGVIFQYQVSKCCANSSLCEFDSKSIRTLHLIYIVRESVSSSELANLFNSKKNRTDSNDVLFFLFPFFLRVVQFINL